MKTPIAILIVLFCYNSNFSQALFNPEKSRMSIRGTSTLHDWESVVEMEEVKIELHIEDEDPLLLGHLRLRIPVKSIRSGNRIMDNKTYAALKADEYPTIKYKVEGFDHKQGQVTASNGLLKIAGVEKAVPVTANYTRNNSGVLEFTGTVSLKMSEFNIDPPSAMIGTLKTGDEINIDYTIAFKTKNN